MDPSESGEGNHWRINLHFRAITVGGDSVIDHSTDGDDFCLLVSPYLASDGSFQDEGKREGIVPNIAPRPRTNRADCS